MTARRLLLIGFGRVGRTLARILLEPKRYPGLAGLETTVVGITTATRGSLAAPRGIDLESALADLERCGRFLPTTPGFAEIDSRRALETLDYDVLVELSTLSVSGRGEPATSHLRGALARGKDAITCNKGPIAWSRKELTELAAARGGRLLHEGTVMDGVPIFNLARHGLRGNRVNRLEGLLNSTTNIVLGGLEQGASLVEAVRAAREAGVAEADPTDDLQGWDGAVKLAVLANALMETGITPDQVAREAVTEASAERARSALARGCRLKSICTVERDGSGLRAAVVLRELPADHPFALIRGAGSALRFETDLLGSFTVTEENPDLRTTAYAVIADLFALAGAEPVRSPSS